MALLDESAMAILGLLFAAYLLVWTFVGLYVDLTYGATYIELLQQVLLLLPATGLVWFHGSMLRHVLAVRIGSTFLRLSRSSVTRLAASAIIAICILLFGSQSSDISLFRSKGNSWSCVPTSPQRSTTHSPIVVLSEARSGTNLWFDYPNACGTAYTGTGMVMAENKLPFSAKMDHHWS
jgi:hypothetical protein